MKKFRPFILLLAMTVLQSCNSKYDKRYIFGKNATSYEISSNEVKVKGSYLRLDKNSYDFGTVRSKKTKVVSINCTIENTGIAPLLILKADVSCGCLSVEYPKEPITQDKKAVLKISIDLKGQEGVFNKTIFLKSNAVNDVELIKIQGFVK